MLHRRSVLTGLLAAVAAPAIVRWQSIMPVKTVLWPEAGPAIGQQVWESYPWVVKVDYDKVRADRMDFKFVEVTCPYELEKLLKYQQETGVTVVASPIRSFAALKE
jgi:hypothetical protein